MELNIFGISIDIVKLISPLVYILIAAVFYLVLGKILRLVFERSQGRVSSEQQKQRIQTVYAMLMSIVKYIALIAVFLAILANFGVDVTSLVAGLGIVTAILGLAFQDMIKDIIAGISIITEDLYGVGDLIEVDGFRGRVLSVGLKTTQIKNYRGKVKIVSNRNMDDLVNYSKFDTLAEVVVQASYEDEPEKVLKALERVKAKLDKTMEQMTGEIKIYPVSGYEDSGVKYRLTCPCKPYKHFATQRAIRKEILAEFKKDGIEIPYPHVTVKN